MNGARYNEHTNDNGDWCPWSGQPAARREEEQEGAVCPAGCRGSWVE